MVGLGFLACGAGGCATMRVTDPAHTADEEFLMTEAAVRAVGQLSFGALRGRSVWVVGEYVFSTTQPFDQSFLSNEVRSPQFQEAFLIAELRAKLLQAGVRLAPTRERADIIVEVRSAALSINRVDFLLGVPAGSFGGAAGAAAATNPELALFKSVKQDGFASVAIVGYWRNTGELMVTSGPFIGRTHRYDYFVFGYALQPVGDIPPTQVGGAK
ncbi:MAG TPA: DUF6655 family protein [Tepidisphaeraceae bacterium]|nr:DUF6655 family protein [Tepidisphaeraceae bacterium]